MSVGLAIAERWLAAHFNRPDYPVVDWRVWALCGDGCMMEGISNEAASLAGHLKLNKLCWIYDSNRVSIEGHTEIAFTEDVATRFLGLGWNVLHVRDANDEQEVLGAFDLAKQEPGRPSLIIIESHIGYGAPHKQDSPEAHGEPLGEQEVKDTKRFYGWPEDAQFLVPDGVYAAFRRGHRRPWCAPGTPNGVPCSSATASRIPISRRPSMPCSGVSCLRVGRKPSRPSPPILKASPAAIPRPRSRTRSPGKSPG